MGRGEVVEAEIVRSLRGCEEGREVGGRRRRLKLDRQGFDAKRGDQRLLRRQSGLHGVLLVYWRAGGPIVQSRCCFKLVNPVRDLRLGRDWRRDDGNVVLLCRLRA